MLCGTFMKLQTVIDDEITAHSRCYLLFDNRIRSERTADSR